MTRGVVAGAAASALGDELAVTALLIRVYDGGGSGTSVAAVLVAGMLPQVAFAPVAGWLVDRVETRRLLTWVSALQAAVLLVMAHVATLWVLVAGCAVLSAGAAVANAGMLSLVPALAGADGGARYLSTLQAAQRAGWAVGPVLGAVSTARFGASWALTADAATFLLLALVLASSGVERRPARRALEEPYERPVELLAGVRAIWADPQLRVGFGAAIVACVGAGVTNVTDVFLAKDILASGSVGFGVLVGLYGLGMASGSYAARWVPAERLLASLGVASVVAGVAVVTPAVVPHLGVAVVTYLAAGAGNGLTVTLLRTLLLRRVRPEAHGRAFAAEGAAGTAALVLALGIGALLVEAVGVRSAVVLAGAAAALPGVVLLAVNPAPSATGHGTAKQTPVRAPAAATP